MGYGMRQKAGLVSGPLVFMLILLLPSPESMSGEAMRVVAVTALMAIFWITEAIPIAATALMPIALFPVLNVMPTAKVTGAYGNHLIYLFLGGFLLAVAIEKWNLHKRIALRTVLLIGVTPQRIILGFMIATAFLSCWISNTATAMLMVTIAMAVLNQLAAANRLISERGDIKQTNFGLALMLGIAYAASIGGVATLVGTPPNAIFAGIVEKQLGYTVGFAQWMMFATPLSIIMLALTWLYLTKLAYPNDIEGLPGGKAAIQKSLKELGAMSRQEKSVLAVFSFVVAAWLFRGLLEFDFLKEVTDSSVAICGAVLLFIIPADLKKGEFLLDWKTAVRIPWDIILLFGGGFALAAAFASTGLTAWVGQELTILHGATTLLIVLVVVVIVIFLTEVTSNTATASLLLPIMAGFAMATDVPVLSLMAGVALAASFAFMLPVATPPNAIVFSSRQVTIPQMAKAGLALNILGTALITLFVVYVLPFVIGM
jgi:sodium-dependent dicarboxylate transporter 2/3/5